MRRTTSYLLNRACAQFGELKLSDNDMAAAIDIERLGLGWVEHDESGTWLILTAKGLARR